MKYSRFKNFLREKLMPALLPPLLEKQDQSELNKADLLSNAEQLDITLPEHGNAKIDSMIMRPKIPTDKYLVLVCGNDAGYENYGIFINSYLQEGFNVVCFNPMGVDQSQGKTRGPDDYVDALHAVIEAVKKSQQTTCEDITVLGYSFGGAIAAKCICDYYLNSETPRLILDRTFTNISEISKKIRLPSLFPRTTRALLKYLNFEVDVKKAFETICEKKPGCAVAYNSRQDEEIPYKHSLMATASSDSLQYCRETIPKFESQVHFLPPDLFTTSDTKEKLMSNAEKMLSITTDNTLETDKPETERRYSTDSSMSVSTMSSTDEPTELEQGTTSNENTLAAISDLAQNKKIKESKDSHQPLVTSFSDSKENAAQLDTYVQQKTDESHESEQQLQVSSEVVESKSLEGPKDKQPIVTNFTDSKENRPQLQRYIQQTTGESHEAEQQQASREVSQSENTDTLEKRSSYIKEKPVEPENDTSQENLQHTETESNKDTVANKIQAWEGRIRNRQDKPSNKTRH